MSIIEIALKEVRQGLLGLTRLPYDPETDTPISEYLDQYERIYADGAIIQPGEGYNLLIVVQSLEDNASASGLIIKYQDAYHRKYIQKSNYAYYLSNEGFNNEVDLIPCQTKTAIIIQETELFDSYTITQNTE